MVIGDRLNWSDETKNNWILKLSMSLFVSRKLKELIDQK